MNIQAIKTHPVTIGEDIYEIIDRYLPQLAENSIVAITSKIISICQKRVINISSVKDKNLLIKQEADAVQAIEEASDIHLTIKDDRIVPFAGIDESNGNGYYILYSEDAQSVAQKLWQYLRGKHNLNNLGIIITDSNITMLRRGVTGIAVGWCGFEAIYNYCDKKDIFGRRLQMTYVNNIDALAAAAVFVMGEGEESTPIAIIEDTSRISFSHMPPLKEEIEKVKIPITEDFYGPIISATRWIWKDNS